MKTFVSNVDSPLGYALSRHFSSTIVGSRKEPEGGANEEEIPPATEEETIKKLEEKVKQNYTVIGTLTTRRALTPSNPDYGSSQSTPSLPGNYFETSDKKKNAIRKEAIARFAVPGQKPKWVSELVQVQEDRDALKKALLDSDVIVYDLLTSLDEASWAIEYMSELADGFEKPKTFIGVSSLMTWAKTKVESDDSEAALTEDEYRRRKPHPNFKNHLAVEKNIIKFGKKSQLKTYVIAAGFIYHSGDCLFHHFLKSAWLNEPELLCFGDGNNILPTIYLDDLTSIVVETAETSPETKYLVAIDDSKSTLFEILKAISEALGSGAVKKVPKESAFLNSKLSQTEIDMLQTNLKLDPGHIKEMNIEWKYETGLIENIQPLIQEYRDARGLSSLKILVHGPPASGKTFFAKKIADMYELHYLEPDQVMLEAMEALERKIARNTGIEEPEEDFEDAKESLAELKELQKTNNGVFPSSKILEHVKERIKSMPCRNQGYVLDGYPRKLSEAKEIFKSLNDDDGKEEKGLATCDETIIPDNVISIDASDAFIKNRIMRLPESAIAGTRNTEEELKARLEEFRADNTDENTVLNYFDELEIHPFILPVEKQDTDSLVQSIKKHVGKPHNYGPSPEQLAEKRRQEEERFAKENEALELQKKKRELEESERHQKAMQDWQSRLAEVRKQEQQVLEAQSLPLRNYLMKHVMPTVTAGLIDVCKIRPEDPIDYLAEYLFKNNPENSK